jgi:two-component system chemotaxis sensor kinase CheA
MAQSSSFRNSFSADEMAEFLRLYLDETNENLDALVEALLTLEAQPTNTAGLNEAFRLIHSIKGASGLLGLDKVTSLTHHLESHFERLRSGRRILDLETMNVVLRCVDYLRDSNRRLQEGEAITAAGPLLDEVMGLEKTAPAAAPAAAATSSPVPAPEPAPVPAAPQPAEALAWRLGVHLRAGLAMAELKAELLLTRLAALGTIGDCQPPRAAFAEHPGLTAIEIIFVSSADRAAIAETAGIDGVERFDIEPAAADARARSIGPAVAAAPIPAAAPAPPPAPDTGSDEAGSQPLPVTSLAETVRVGVDRLDVLLNLTGELVVNRARLAQLAGELAPAFRKSRGVSRSQAAAEAIRDLVRGQGDRGPGGHPERLAIEEQLAAIEEQARLQEQRAQAFGELAAALDQLTRVSTSLQRGVLNTRMVPVGPLFNRFKRSVRDMANDLGKRVKLEVAGEKTELDKRMIDEIGDPLNHLLRNCIDHGVEPAAVRLARGKPEIATVRLSAAHRGNNVFITVEDDGGGIDVERVRQVARERGVIAAATAAALPDDEAIALIFEPGFSTAAAVSDISGRGVGMDIVRTRINGLNGTIEVDTTPGRGTRFTIRLPLTLTIARCMVFRLPQGVLAVPVEHVREITHAAGHRSVVVEGRRVCDIRGELLPLLGIADLFAWPQAAADAADGGHVAVLQSGSRAVGLRVNEVLGGRDLVVKPLDENFIHIRGLGGASILGDGSVCLLLDVAACLDLGRRTGDAFAKATAAPAG